MSEKKEQVSAVNLVNKRPLSPHLTIYKPQISSMLSITHRATGFFLYFGLVFLCWMIFSFSSCTDCSSSIFLKFSTSIIGKLMIFGWSVSFFYHLANGIRHLFWDIGKGYSICSMRKSGWLVMVITMLLTVIFWGNILNF